MSMFFCQGCQTLVDSDYMGYNIDENDEEYCDDHWYEVCERYQRFCEIGGLDD